MHLSRLRIRELRNLRDFEITFTAGVKDADGVVHDFKSHAVIGQNGSGKSNMIEAIVTIFRDLDLSAPQGALCESGERLFFSTRRNKEGHKGERVGSIASSGHEAFPHRRPSTGMKRNLVMSSSKRGNLLKDPHGGLTAAGRRYFARTQGAHLRPGVMKAQKDMTPEDMQRKGAFLRRHYGRKNPFKLVDAKGQPTRYALQAQAWGERLPKTQEDIERLAAKGQKLLANAKRLKHGGEVKSPAQSKASTTSRSESRRS